MFKTQKFCHIASNNRNQVKAGVFVYRTTDDLATVSASGYFNERIIDINLHDLIIHEKIDASDATKVQRNVLCVTERTLENVGVVVIKSKWEEDIEGDIEDLDGKIAALKTYVEQHFVNIDGSSIMSGPLKFRAGSFEGAIGGGLGDGISVYKMNADGSINSEVASLTKTNGFVPGTTNSMNIGSNSLKWKDAYIGRVISGVLNNGADINVPTISGTLALLSDIGVGTHNISNCLTEIPQDINLTLSSGTLTLKSGSVLYKGDGSFTKVTLANDISISPTPSNGKRLVFTNGVAYLDTIDIDAWVSGSTEPTSGLLWFNTTDNKIYNGGPGNWAASSVCLPLGVVTVSGNQIVSIDQVFNGFGFMGSTIFALPGVKGLIPNGRNADGSLNNTEFTLSSVLTLTDSSGSDNVLLVNASALARVTASNYFYDEEKNIIINKYNNSQVLSVLYGTNTTRKGVVSNFATRTVFHAADYNDLVEKQDKATALNYDNISNCVTKIPQDIIQKTSALFSAGSKVYFPDETYVVLPQDIGFSGGSVAASKCFGVIRKSYYSSYSYIPVDHCFSGSTAPTGLTSGVNYYWLDTSASPYVIKRTYDAGATWVETDFSLPLCTLSMSAGFPSSIDQVFNGFGFMGSTIFMLPGVTLVKPNGRNTDGSLKNTISTTTSVRTNSQVRPSTNGYLIYAPSGQSIQKSAAKTNWYYDERRNLVSNLGGDTSWMIWGSYTTDANDRITSFEPKTAFHAVDYNEYSNLDSSVVKLADAQTVPGDKSFTGTLTAVTPSASDNSTKVATTAWCSGHGILIDSQMPTADNNYTWYRKYSDGWVEQGGLLAVTDGSSGSVVLPVPMSSNYYNVIISTYDSGNQAVIYTNRTTTGFDYSGNVGKDSWEAKGIAA